MPTTTGTLPPGPPRRFRLSGAATAACLIPLAASPPAARANPGHEITIAELSVQIARSPDPGPDLFFQRAWNYREIGQSGAARADWEQCLVLQPGFLPASRELARMEAAEGKVEAAAARLRKALAAAPADQAFHRPGCRSVLGQLLMEQGKNQEALEEALTAILESPALQIDLVLLRSEARRRLGQFAERAGELADAQQKIRSFVLRAKWYDAMIDAGRGLEILPEIENELAHTRYQSSWLIRRARIRLQQNQQGPAAEDLAAALAEMAPRIHPETPDVTLLCDRGVVHALQGNLPRAVEDLVLARQHGADFWLTLSLRALIPEDQLPPLPNPRTLPGHPGFRPAPAASPAPVPAPPSPPASMPAK